MAVQFKNAGAEAASTSNIGLAVPASPATNDIWIAVVHSSDQLAHSMDAAWTQIAQGNGSGTTSRISVWWFRYAGSNPVMTVTHASDGTIIGAIAAFTGCITTGSPVDTISAITAGPTDATIEFANCDPVEANGIAIACDGSADDNARSSIPTGFTARFEDTAAGVDNCYKSLVGTPDGSVACHTKEYTTADLLTGLVDTQAASDPWASIMVTLKPPASTLSNRSCSTNAACTASASRLATLARTCNANAAASASATRMAVFPRACSANAACSADAVRAAIYARVCSANAACTAAASRIATLFRACSANAAAIATAVGSRIYTRACSVGADCVATASRVVTFMRSCSANAAATADAARSAGIFSRDCSANAPCSATANRLATLFRACSANAAAIATAARIAIYPRTCTASAPATAAASRVAIYPRACSAVAACTASAIRALGGGGAALRSIVFSFNRRTKIW